MQTAFFNAGAAALFLPVAREFDTTRTATPFSMDPTHGAMEDQRRTVRKLQRLDLNRIGPGHGPEIDDPVRYLADLTESIRNREW